MILVPYDGSAGAQAAIDEAAQLMPGVETRVLTIWEPLIRTLARSGSLGMGVGIGIAGSYADSERIDAASADRALVTATEGADRATAAGLVARPQSTGGGESVASTILGVATQIGADAVGFGASRCSSSRWPPGCPGARRHGAVSRAVPHRARRHSVVHHCGPRSCAHAGRPSC